MCFGTCSGILWPGAQQTEVRPEKAEERAEADT